MYAIIGFCLGTIITIISHLFREKEYFYAVMGVIGFVAYLAQIVLLSR